MKNLLITHPDCTRHVLPGHPESPQRLVAVVERLRTSGIAQQLRRVEATEASDEQLLRVHPESFIRAIEALESHEGVIRVDADTFMSPGSTRAAKLAAGACAMATGLILAGEACTAFCAVRPPGHHAELAQAMGFCLFNNVAVGAMTALADDTIERIAILDFDVHHCNGTVDIFKDDERVLVCSSFQDHFYPNRYLDFTNRHIINTPLPAGTRSYAFRRSIERDWLPAIRSHRPQFVFVSAGFDAHRNDPIGGLELVEEDYRWITELILGEADDFAEGRVVSTLEGGYDLEALAASAAIHVQALADYSR
jgi:acetoin utilization deacetylase AcuC-like enzyme